MAVAIAILGLYGLEKSSVSECDEHAICFIGIVESVPSHAYPALWQIPAEVNFVRLRTHAISVVIVIRLQVYGLLHIFKHGYHFVLTDFTIGPHNYQSYQILSANAGVVDCDRARTEYRKFTVESFSLGIFPIKTIPWLFQYFFTESNQ